MIKQFETPILFLIFNRPDTTQQVFNQIKSIQPKYLFIASDGPRTDRAGETEKCQETKGIMQQIDWNCEVKTLFRDTNLGCKIAVSSAISWFFENVEQGIILEDDCLPEPSFFHFCEVLLHKYQNDSRIIQINGTNFSGIKVNDPNSYYFTQFNSIWGWATWRRAWVNYDVNMADYPEHQRTLFNNPLYISKSATNHYESAIKEMYTQKHNTWYTPWLYTCIKNKGLSITPQTNLVKNIGADNNPTHPFLKDSFRDDIELGKMSLPLVHPELVINNSIDRLSFENYRGKSIHRILRIIEENSIYKVAMYYFKVHLMSKLRR